MHDDYRLAQADREALWTLLLYAVYFAWWCVCAYGLGGGDVAEYQYVCGLPAWFFCSCIAGYPLLTLLLWLVVHRKFADMPLDDEGGRP